MTQSPFLLVKQLQGDVLRRLAHVDSADLSPAQQQDLADMKNGLIDARLDIQDYELAETRDDQLRNARDAKKRLVIIHTLVTQDSLGVFDAVDTAHISAQIEQVIDRLR